MADKKIRVLRLLEYTYSSIDDMERDQALWHTGVSGMRNHGHVAIRSTTLPLEVLDVAEPHDHDPDQP